MPSVRLIFALHNHQPVGNFDDVFASAYRLSYQPFLDVLESYPEIKFALHTSGPLMEWLVANRPEYIWPALFTSMSTLPNFSLVALTEEWSGTEVKMFVPLLQRELGRDRRRNST